MADPSGPTVAEGPEELNTPSSSPSAGAPQAPAGASPTGDAPDAERPPAVADETGTVADADAARDDDAVTDAVTAGAAPETTTVVPAEPSGATSGWPADAPADPVPAVDRAEPPSTVTSDDAGGAGDKAVDDSDGDDGDGDSDDDDDELDDDDAAAKTGLLNKKIQLDAKVLLTVLAVVGFLAVAAGAYLIGQRQAKDAAGPRPGPTATTVFKLPNEYVTFEDKETGVSLSIPKEWRQRSTKNLGPEARMLLEVPNTQDTVLLRVNSYSKEVTAENLGDQKAFIDALFAGEKITILETVPGDLGGMPTLAYVYNFTDPTGVVGIHAHYFIFQGRKAVQLVFQALPTDHYSSGGLGAVWSKISESIKITPGPPPAFLEQLGAAQTGATTVPGPATTAPPASAPPSTG